MAKKKQLTRSEARSLHIQRVVFILIGAIVILSMVIAMIAK